MGYSAADESFTHQWPRPFDEVHHPHGSWSDRCYFFAHSPDGSLLVTNGYGNNPNQRSALGYGKVALADGRHWDLTAGRRVTGADRDDLCAGPMRWTCVEPLKHWLLELGPERLGHRVGDALRAPCARCGSCCRWRSPSTAGRSSTCST